MTELEQIFPGDDAAPAAEPEATQDLAPQPEATPEAAPESSSTEASTRPQEPVMVPLPVVQDLRQEIRDLKAQLQPPAAPPPPPDVLENPEGYTQHLQQQLAVTQAHFAAEMSEMKARTRHGDEVVNAAFAAAKAAGNIDQFRNGPDPWGRVVDWHQGEQVRREVGDDPAAYRAKLEAELRQKIQAEMVASTAQQKAQMAAPSLANATGSTGGRAPTWNGPTPLEEIVG